MPDITTNFCEANFAYSLRTATEAAARAAYQWIGRGNKRESDHAAQAAMRRAIEALPIAGKMIIGTSDPEDANALHKGEFVGRKEAPRRFDIAADPVEGISYLAKGMTNAMAVLAMAPEGALFDTGPAFYMDKFVAPPAAKGKIDMDASLEEKLVSLAEILKKPVRDLTIFVLEKPRHRNLVERIHAAGARVALYPAGDIAGALMASIPKSGIDALMGTGGAPEATLSACAIRVLGGEFGARINPQLPSEQIAVRKAGLDTQKWYSAEDLVASKDVFFCATGITTGLLFRGVEPSGDGERTESLLINGITGERQILTTFHQDFAEGPADA